MGASGSIMAGMYGVQAINAYSTGQNNANAIKGQAAYTSMIARSNERLSEMSAIDALKQGDLAAGKIRRDASRVRGAQKVNLAAQGIDINSGSAVDLQTETETMSQYDIDTAKNNAWRAAWGYRVQANNFEGQARMAEIGGKYGARATVLTAGIQAAGYAAQAGYQYQKGQNTEDILGKMGKETKLPADNNDDPAGKTRNVASVDPKTGMGWHPDDGKSGPGFYGSSPRRTRQNPFGGPDMTSSWWIQYDEETA